MIMIFIIYLVAIVGASNIFFYWQVMASYGNLKKSIMIFNLMLANVSRLTRQQDKRNQYLLMV